MLKAWPEPEKPAAVIGRNVRRDDREPVRGSHQGSGQSTANAVHMTTPAEEHHPLRKPLQQGSHPHMTALARAASLELGRDGETPFSRTEKHLKQERLPAV